MDKNGNLTGLCASRNSKMECSHSVAIQSHSVGGFQKISVYSKLIKTMFQKIKALKTVTMEQLMIIVLGKL